MKVRIRRSFFIFHSILPDNSLKFKLFLGLFPFFREKRVLTYYFLCYHPQLAPPQPNPPPQNQPPEPQPNPPPKPPPHHLPPPGRLFTTEIFPVEKDQSKTHKIQLAIIHPSIAITIVPRRNHITNPPKIAPITIPGHQALEDAKKVFPKNAPHQHRKMINEIQMPVTSFGGSGMVTTSPFNKGIITSTADRSHGPYSSFLKAGVRYSSIIRCEIRSVITHSNPLPTSIRISCSVGATRIRSPLSNHFCPIHHVRAMAIPASSIVRP